MLFRSIKLFTREEMLEVVQLIDRLFELWINKAEQTKEILIPGYTHLQVAMPSSFGMWYSAYAESLADDLLMVKAAYDGVAKCNEIHIKLNTYIQLE